MKKKKKRNNRSKRGRTENLSDLERFLRVFENDFQRNETSARPISSLLHFYVNTAWNNRRSTPPLFLHWDTFHNYRLTFLQRLPSVLHFPRLSSQIFSIPLPSNSLSPDGRERQSKLMKIRNARSYFFPPRILYVYAVYRLWRIFFSFLFFSITVCIFDSGKKQQEKRKWKLSLWGWIFFHMQTHTQITQG